MKLPQEAYLKNSPLLAESENLFFLKGINLKLEFIKDNNGNVIKLIFHMNGIDKTDEKIK